MTTTSATHRHLGVPGPRATRVGIGGFYLAMSGLNIGIVIGDSETYRHFADSGLFSFVTGGWQDIVMAAPGAWIGLLAAGEIAVGAALLAGGRWTLPGYVAIVAFHLALVLFGWGFLTWSVPVLLLMSQVVRRELLTRRGTKDPASRDVRSWWKRLRRTTLEACPMRSPRAAVPSSSASSATSPQ